MTARLYTAHIVGALLLLAAPGAATANDEGIEIWFNPSIATDLDANTGIELETAQRFRNADDGRGDTYFLRLWLNQQVAEQWALSGAVEQRINDGGSDELRTIQQLSGRHGIFRTRFRLEQRFVEDRGGRMGLRFRPRAGISIPLDERGDWSFRSDAELFWTLRGTSPGGDTGITGLRTQLGVGYEVSENVALSLTYLRQQSFEDGGPDTVGHAPLVGLELTF